MSWIDSLAPNSKMDGYLRLAVAFMLLVWNVIVSTHIHTPYPSVLIDTYAIPVTRIFLLFLVIMSALWCPTVGILAALAYVCLGADVLHLTRDYKGFQP